MKPMLPMPIATWCAASAAVPRRPARIPVVEKTPASSA